MSVNVPPPPDLSAEQALENRKQLVLERLNDAELQTKGDEDLRRYVLNELRDDLQPTIDRARTDDSPEAEIIQFGDIFLNRTIERDFAEAFLRKFGARATVPVSQRTFEDKCFRTISDFHPGPYPQERQVDKDDPKNKIPYTTNVGLDNLKGVVLSAPWVHINRDGTCPDTEGTALLINENGYFNYLIVETDIEGVRIKMDGSVITDPTGQYNRRGSSLRPMLLVRI